MDRKSFGFGSRLRAAREAAGLSGTELGVGAGENGKNASKASVSDWEHDRHYPKADQLRVICLKLNINVDDLIFGDIKQNLKILQAESAIRALSPDQRQALIDRMAYATRAGQTPKTGSNDVLQTESIGEGVNFLDDARIPDDGRSDTHPEDRRRKKPLGKAS